MTKNPPRSSNAEPDGSDTASAPEQVFADLNSVNPMFAGVLRYFECAHLPEPMRSVSATFQSVAWRMANEPAVDPTEMEKALHRLLDAKDAAVRSVLPNNPSFSSK